MKTINIDILGIDRRIRNATGCLAAVIVAIVVILLSWDWSASSGPRIVTTLDGETIRFDSIRFCTERWLLDSRSGKYGLVTNTGVIELPRNFEGISLFEVLEGGESLSIWEKTKRGVEIKRLVEELDKKESETSSRTLPPSKEHREIVDKEIGELKRKIEEAQRGLVPLKLRITYDSGSVIDGTPETDVLEESNYISGKSPDYDRVTIKIRTVKQIQR